jgi:antitoxin component YwqK of YwqJK toxin-antitoxin module
VKTGKWEYRSIDGNRVVGIYEAGRRTGLWRILDVDDGRVAEEVRYVDGKREGTFVRFRGTRKIEEGGYHLGRKTGVWTRWYGNGGVEERKEYRDGSEHGLSESFWEDGKNLSVANYVWGVLDGHLQAWNQGGELVEEGEMVAGKRSGRWVIRKAGELITVDY